MEGYRSSVGRHRVGAACAFTSHADALLSAIVATTAVLVAATAADAGARVVEDRDQFADKNHPKASQALAEPGAGDGQEALRRDVPAFNRAIAGGMTPLTGIQ